MKFLIIITLFLVITLPTEGQTFKNITPTPIPDDSSELLIPITVSGLPGAIDQSFGMTEVCLTIRHNYMYTLEVQLKAPNNHRIKLSDNCGDFNAPFDKVCFQLGPALTNICATNPPYTGAYYPYQSLNIVNHGQNPNGIWHLAIRDVDKGVNTGICDSVTLSFGPNPPVGPNYPCSKEDPWRCTCPDGNDTCNLLPDMTASQKAMGDNHTEYHDSLTLDNATPNIGWGPIEIHGKNECFCDATQVPCSTVLCPDGHEPHEKIIQRVYRKEGDTIITYDRDAGFMHFHATHGHIHLDHWSNYTLRRKMDGNPIASEWPIVGKGNKVSFCLINLSDCDDSDGYCVDENGNTLHKADLPNADFGYVEGCERHQGIFVANVDVYDQNLPDQVIHFPGICNGQYYMVSITDPENNILESRDDNNWAAAPVNLTQQQSAGSIPTSFTYSITGNQVNFTNLSPNGRPYYWEFGDGSIDTARNPVHTFSSVTSYQVKLHALDYCLTTSTQNVDLTMAGVSKSTIGVHALEVYPNPANDKIHCRFYLAQGGAVQLQVFNALGNNLWNGSEDIYASGLQDILLDRHQLHLDPGYHLLKLTYQGQSVSVPFVVMD